MSRNDEHFDVQEYMTKGVENVVADALKATLKDPRASAFMLKFAAASRAASKKRREAVIFLPNSHSPASREQPI